MWPLLLPAWLLLPFNARTMNQYRLGEATAASRGVRVERFRAMCILVCTLATAAVVAECGPIGFVGLVVPHMVALALGRDCRLLLPASALLGGAFLILCDWGAQSAMRVAGWATNRQLGGATLPIGVVTALVGVPLFLLLLRASRRRTPLYGS
jgi:iron complex transport system permease protein